MRNRFKTISETGQVSELVPLTAEENAPNQQIVNVRIEDFLEQVTGRLLVLPFVQREGIRRELRQHLESSIAARIELGDTSGVAIEAALRVFGDPAVIARRYRRAYETTGTQSDSSFIPTFKYALKLFLPAMAGFLLVEAAILTNFPYRRFNNLHDDAFFALVNGVTLLFYILPVFLGFRIGWKRPGAAMVGVTIALASLALITTPLSYFYFDGHEGQLRNLYLLVGMMFGTWIPLAAIPAAIAGSLKTRLIRSRLRLAR